MYIFLDIDGVLNTTSDWKELYILNKKNIQAFATFVKKYNNVKIILTSSWRTGWNKNIELCTPQIKKLMFLFNEYNLTISH